jgi:hypothetical protein
MTTAIDDTQEDEDEAFHRRIERLEEAITAMLNAAHIHGDGETVRVLINCLGTVLGSIECANRRNDFIETATEHFNDTMEDIKQQQPPSEDHSEETPSGHVH